MLAGRERRPIPGPRGAALWKFVFEFPRAPHERLLQLVAEYGDIVDLDLPLERVVVIARPEYVEHVLHHRHQNYDKQTARWEAVRQVWGTGLLVADGDLWRRQRQRMQPAFHQEALQRFATIVVEEAQQIAALWTADPNGGHRDVYKDMLACAVRAIARAMFGADVESRTETITVALGDVHEYINPMSVLNVWRVPPRVQRFINPEYPALPPGVSGDQRDLRRDRDRAAGRAAGSRRPPRHDDGGARRRGVRDDESPAVARRDDGDADGRARDHRHCECLVLALDLAVTGDRKSIPRGARFRAGGRAPTFEDLNKLTYTRMILQEALRITPPTWGIDRRAREDDEIDGYAIPKGTNVALSSYVMHHHPGYWESPGRSTLSDSATTARRHVPPTRTFRSAAVRGGAWVCASPCWKRN